MKKNCFKSVRITLCSLIAYGQVAYCSDYWGQFKVESPFSQNTENEAQNLHDFLETHFDKKFQTYLANDGFEEQFPQFHSPQKLQGVTTSKNESFSFDDLPAADALLASLPEEPAFTDLATLIQEKPPQSEPQKSQHLVISLSENGLLQANMKSVEFSHVGQSITYEVLDSLKEQILVHTRNDGLIEVDRAQQSFRSLSPGESEIFFIYNDKITIISALIQPDDNTKHLAVPQELAELPTLGITADTSASQLGTPRITTKNSYSVANNQNPVKTILVDDSLHFTIRPKHLKYSNMILQIVDERTSTVAGKVYPVGGAKVQILGTDFFAHTDNRGVLEIRDLPEEASFLIRIADDDNLLQPTLAKVSSGNENKIVALRSATFDVLQRMANLTQNSFLGSMCLHILDEDGLTLENVAAVIDSSAEGPFYFNQYGFLDPSLKTTGANGRVCFFNVETGPSAIHVFHNDELLKTSVVASFPGLHQETDLSVSDEHISSGVVIPALYASAHTHLSSNYKLLEDLRPLEWASLTPLASSDALVFQDHAKLRLPKNIQLENGAARLLSQATDFEETLFDLPVHKNQEIVVPFIPRGYIEDMAYYAQTQINPFDGRVLVEHQAFSNQGEEQVVFHLVDAENNEVEEAWTFAHGAQTKSLFFNVSPGYYSLLVKTESGYWLAARNVYVYSSTVTYVATGSSLQLKTP